MKKILLAIGLIVVTVLTGCNAAEEDKTPEATDIVVESVKNVECTEVIVIPDPEKFFEDAKVTLINTDSNIMYYVEEFKDETYDSYVDSCTEAGFTNISYKGETENGSKLFYAYDENEEYYLEITLDAPSNRITIICRVNE